MTTETQAKDFLKEEQETFHIYSDDSDDDYSFHDVLDEKDQVVVNTPSYSDWNDNNKQKNAPLTSSDSFSSSSSFSSSDETSYFDKPIRTQSEDTVMTPIQLDKKDTALKNTKLDQQNDTKDYNDAIREATIVFEPILEHKDETINATDKGSLSDITLEDETTVSSQDESKAMSDISLEDPSAETISFDGAPEKEAAVTPTQDDHIHSKEISLEPEDVDFEEPKHSSSLHTLEEEDEEDQDENAQQKEKQSFNPLSIITKGLVTGEQPIITTVPVPTDPAMIHKTKETTFSPSSSVPNSPRQSLDNESISSTTSKSIFGRWTPFRSSSSSATSPSTSRRPSKQHSAPIPSASRPSASFAARQSQLSRPNSIISPLPGFQETLLAQMEQLNVSNTNDPKSKVLKNLKRQSIRQSLVSQNKGDEYDWDFWAGTMCDIQTFHRVDKDLIKHVSFGIPPSIRGMVWQILAKSKDETLADKYMALLREQSPYDKMIQRDLARTFPGHAYFKEKDGQGQEGLYNVVRAYSLYDSGVGYCQGLAFIVGPLLLNMPDEDAFCVLVQLMTKYDLRGHFTPEMDGLLLRLYQFDALVSEHLPHVSRHLERLGISSNIYASQWFMTLFAYKFPLNLVFRIYDVIFTQGINAIFKFAISLLKRNQTTILGLDFEHLLNFLKNGLFEEYKDDDRRFVSDACELEIPAKRLAQLEKEHKTQLQKELANANLLDELQKSNIELKKQLKELEIKTDTLKQEHQHVNDQLDETLHELNAVKDEGSSLNSIVTSLQTAVDGLPEKIENGSKDQFEGLCQENATLIGKNSTLEDDLQKAESILIDMKIRYAQSENEKEELQRKLYELKKLMSF